MPSRKNKRIEYFLSGRFYFVVVCVLLLFVGLFVRAAWIQVVFPDQLIQEGDKRSLRVATENVQRGSITDRNGKELAISLPVMAVFADGRDIARGDTLQRTKALQALADVLNLDESQLIRRISDPKKRFVYLKRQVSPAMADYVRKLDLEGIRMIPESRRFYPTGEITAQLVGFTDIDDNGQEGIERSYNDWLTGESDRRHVRRDRLGRVIEELSTEQGIDPNDLQLSIDQRVQAVAYQALKKAVKYHEATAGSAVVLNVHTGEVLAMVNSPSFNPNNRSQYQSYRIRNRAITDTFEPGSIIKPLVVASALHNGLVTSSSIINTHPGWMRVGGHLVRDTQNRGKMSLSTMMKYSSNMGTSKLALNLGHERLLETYYQFGIGGDSVLGLNGETPGNLPQRKRWSDFEVATLSFGYGFSTNTLQLAQMYATLAAGGQYRPVSLLKLDTPAPAEQVLSHQNAMDVLAMLEHVTMEGGTATKAQIKGYRVAGKTGTARKAIAGGYGDEYVVSFAGVVPLSNPQLAMAVVINEPQGDVYSGGGVAAPVFSETMKGVLRILNIAPDAHTRSVLAPTVPYKSGDADVQT